MLVKNTSAEIKDLDGGLLNLPTGEMDDNGAPEKKALTYQRAMINGLLQGTDQQNLDGAAKLKRWQLAKRISANAAEVELSAEETTTILGGVSKSYATLVYGRVCELLGEDK